MDVQAVLAQMTLEEKAGMCSGADFWHLRGVPRLGIPSIMVTDGPHGLRKQGSETDHLGLNESVVAICFPTASALAASFDRDLLREVGSALGKECLAEEVGVLLGPGANIKRSPLCGRNFEYFSEDPFLSSELAEAFTYGLQGEGVGCSIKHFAANNQETDRMLSDSVVDERTLYEIYLASFEGAVANARAKTVMCSYNKVNGTFAAENERLLTDVLRKLWGFEGLVMTDWGAAKDMIDGIKAGLDLKMPGGRDEDVQEIIEAVQNGRLPEAVLDTTVARILYVIDFVVSNKKEGAQYSREDDHAMARDVAAECAVLLKNDGELLPLRKGGKVAFIGAFAETPRYQGNGSSFINAYRVESALEMSKGMADIIYAKGYELAVDSVDDALLEEAVQAAKGAEVAVLFAGLPNTYESEGFDRKHINLPPNQIALIEAVCAVQPRTVVVLHNGSSVAMPWARQVPAILEMYLGGEAVGGATVRLLFGDAVPGGKLAESFPHKLSDNPSFLNFPGYDGKVEYHEGVYVGYRYYDAKQMDVLFPFGHGLSYAQFAYDNLRLDKSEMKDTESLQVSIDITNSGKVAAKEAVQLYVGQVTGEVPRPVRELKGFAKVALQPGETKQVTFTLSKRAFAYYNVTLHDWHVETAQYEIQIGASSRDIRVSSVVGVQSTVDVPVTFSPYTSIEQILKTDKGRIVLGPMLQAMQAMMPGSQEGTDKALGEGGVEMMRLMMMQTPLQSLVGFGMLTKEQMQQILYALNT